MMNHPKAADVLVMVFYVNGWGFNCMRDSFLKRMVQLIAAAAPGFKMPSYDKLHGELLQSVDATQCLKT
eukprot:178030-Chlamydomonas_euryale.AAC.3